MKLRSPVVNVREVDNPARTAIQFRLANVNVDDPTFFTIPPNTRLVVEFVSANARTIGGCVPLSIEVSTTVDGVSVLHSMAPSLVVPGLLDQNFFVISQRTRIYADPGTNVSYSPVAATTQPGVDCQQVQNVQFSGYLVRLR